MSEAEEQRARLSQLLDVLYGAQKQLDASIAKLEEEIHRLTVRLIEERQDKPA